MIDLTKALLSLYPNSAWTLSGDEYEGLTWLDENTPKPTKEELEAEAARLQPIIDCQMNRAREYPSYADQFDLLYHGGYDAWKAAIDAVKTKYPKGA
jgi:hypothetical protein